MEQGEFKKLDVDLPRAPIADTRPWLIGGLLLVLAILLLAAYAYSRHEQKREVKRGMGVMAVSAVCVLAVLVVLADR